MILLRNFEEFSVLIKKLALAAVSSSNPLEIRYGTVVSDNPLKIQIDQKLVLDQAHLKLTRNVTDYETQASVDGGTKQTFKVFNALKKDEKVVMLRIQGGMPFLVLDRV